MRREVRGFEERFGGAQVGAGFEGWRFYRFAPGEFAHVLNIAYGSLGELLDCADEARHKRYVTPQELDGLDKLIGR